MPSSRASSTARRQAHSTSGATTAQSTASTSAAKMTPTTLPLPCCGPSTCSTKTVQQGQGYSRPRLQYLSMRHSPSIRPLAVSHSKKTQTTNETGKISNRFITWQQMQWAVLATQRRLQAARLKLRPLRKPRLRCHSKHSPIPSWGTTVHRPHREPMGAHLPHHHRAARRA